MALPGFTAESSLGKSERTYRGKPLYSWHLEPSRGVPASDLASDLEDIDSLEDVEAVDFAEEIAADDLEVEGLEDGEEMLANGEEDDLDEETVTDDTEDVDLEA